MKDNYTQRLPGRPKTLGHILDFLLYVCIILEEIRKCFSIKFSMELISFALEALADPTEPGFLDSHPGCIIPGTEEKT